MKEEREVFYFRDSSAKPNEQNTFLHENNDTKMTKSESNREKVDTIYDYECPSIKSRGMSYSSSDDEDFSSAMNYCSGKETDNIKFKDHYASAPSNTDTLGVGSSTPDVRRNSICSITAYKTDRFDLTCTSLPDNNNGYRNSLMGTNEIKVLNKVGSNYKIQKNEDSASISRGRTSSIGTYLNSSSQSALKSKRIHSTISTGSRASMHFSRHF